MITQAMILAAGLGTRMRPLTERTAKPLLPLGGRALLDHALDRLAAAGVRRVAVNIHWRAELVRAHLATRTDVETVALPEADLLDTGGAVLSALRSGALMDAPFFVINGDSFWMDGPTPALGRLAAAFDPAIADAVLLLHRVFQVHNEVGRGDFALDPWGVPRRPGERELVPYVYAGVQLATPGLFAGLDGSFSANAAWNGALAAGRLRAVVHDGLWYHLSRPQDLDEAEAALHANLTGESR